MELKITSFYCLCDDFLISEGWRDDPQCTMSTAEVMTAALTAAAFFSGSYERSCEFLEEHGYMPVMLSKSQFSRRLGSIPESVWRGLLRQLAMPFHTMNSLKIASRGQLSCPCLPEHPHTTLQNLSGRMLPGTCFKPEGILLRAESSCAHDRIRNSCGNIPASRVIFRHKFSL